MSNKSSVNVARLILKSVGPLRFFVGCPRPASQAIVASWTSDQTHHTVPDRYQDDVGNGDRKHGCKPRCIVAPLRKPRHVPIVAWRSEDRCNESHDDETTPTKASGNPPGD